MAGQMKNSDFADKLREMATLLELQGADHFRVGAYRKAAATLTAHDEQAATIIERQGPEGLQALSGIGASLAQAIAEMVRTGSWARLERLRGSLDPEQVFQTVPGIGPRLAHLIHETLHLDTLEGLEMAAHDGRLESVSGVGARRAAMIRAALAAMLVRKRPLSRETTLAPPVDLILDVDGAYRAAAERGELEKIAPRRFNPEGRAWLPILHTTRDGWHFTALYSNTARAHELGRTGDWVVLFFHRDDYGESLCTVVTERGGPLAGRRVVRGREAECRAFYAALSPRNSTAATSATP